MEYTDKILKVAQTIVAGMECLKKPANSSSATRAQENKGSATAPAVTAPTPAAAPTPVTAVPAPTPAATAHTPASVPAAAAPAPKPEAPVNIEKYTKMLKLGVPKEAVVAKMRAEGVPDASVETVLATAAAAPATAAAAPATAAAPAATAPAAAAAAPAAPSNVANELRHKTTAEAMEKRVEAVGKLEQKNPKTYEPRKNLQLMTNIKNQAKVFEQRRKDKGYTYKGGRKRTTVNKRLNKKRRYTYRR